MLLECEYLKGQPAQATYLFYPYAAIKTADGVLCSRPLVRNAAAPKVGDRFLAFSLTPPYTAAGTTILSPDPARELLREAEGGELAMPPALRSSPTNTNSFDAARNVVLQTVTRAAK